MKKFFLFLARLFSGYFSLVEQFGLPAVEWVEKIKAVVALPLFDTITKFTATDLDNKAIELLRKGLPVIERILATLGKTAECNTVANVDEKLLCVLRVIKALPPELQKFVWRELAKFHVGLGVNADSSGTGERSLEAAQNDRVNLNEVVETAYWLYRKKKALL